MNSLSEYELKIVQYLMSNNSITLKITREVLGRGESLARRQLKSLENKGLIEWHGSNKSDPTQYYSLKITK